MMLRQNSPPSSFEASFSFDHGEKLEFSRDRMCANCYKHLHCLISCISCAQNFRNCGSHLPSVSNMSKGPTPLAVYQRKKPQYSRAQASTNTKLSDNNHSAISSDEAPSTPTEEHIRPPGNKGSLVPYSSSDDGCQRFVNEISSSSKSNRDHFSESPGRETDDAAECSSSDALILEEVLPNKVCGPAKIKSTTGDAIHLRRCKGCDQSDTPLNLLICDQCDEAIHLACYNPPIKEVPVGEWFCRSCLKKKQKILDEARTNRSPIIGHDFGRSKNGTSMVGPRETESYTSKVRIGKDFQAEVPDWYGITINEVGSIGEPLEMNSTECFRLQDGSSSKPSRLSPIGNWIQCREVINGVGKEGVDGTICGKWRRAPLFEVQTDNWECFRSFLWDPAQSDCAVPQELDTEQVQKHLKYIEMLKPRLAAKRRKLDHTRSVDSPEVTKDLKNKETT